MAVIRLEVDGLPGGTHDARVPSVARRASPAGEPVLLRLLAARGPMTRAALGEAAGLSRTTVSGLLMDLRRRGLIGDVADRSAEPTGGRPASLLALEPAAGLAVGVDVGRTHVGVAVVDGGHRVLARDRMSMEVDGHPQEVVDVSARMVSKQLAAVGGCTEQVLGVGLGVPAPLDADGRVGASNILPGWTGWAPAADLQSALGMPVRAENDANLGALAEALWGAGQNSRFVIYVKAASGIGAGIVVDGVLFRGATGTAGEIGHTTVTDGGPVCRCGNRGCLEVLAGGAALVGQLGPSGLTVSGLPDLVLLAQQGDPSCRRVLADAGEHLGMALANLVNLMNPEVIVFGGELGLAGELVLTTLRSRVQRSALSPAGGAVQVRTASLGNQAEALGGALLVLREPERFGPDRFERVMAGA